MEYQWTHKTGLWLVIFTPQPWWYPQWTPGFLVFHQKIEKSQEKLSRSEAQCWGCPHSKEFPKEPQSTTWHTPVANHPSHLDATVVAIENGELRWAKGVQRNQKGLAISHFLPFIKSPGQQLASIGYHIQCTRPAPPAKTDACTSWPSTRTPVSSTRCRRGSATSPGSVRGKASRPQCPVKGPNLTSSNCSWLGILAHCWIFVQYPTRCFFVHGVNQNLIIPI